MIDSVTLTLVPVSRRLIIANLIQLYKYDFSEFAKIGSPYGEVGSDGRFVYDGLDSYWREDGRVPLTVQADGRLVGFILVNRWSALDRELDHSVAEFFVLLKYRRIGVGSRAAKLLFERWPGRWEVAVASYTGLRKFLDMSVRSISAADTGITYRASGAGAQATAQSERTRPWLLANLFQAISLTSIIFARLGNTEFASQWLRR